MSKKKLGKMLAAGLAAYGASKMFGGKKNLITDTADLGSESKNVSALISGDTANTRGALKAAMAKKAMTPSNKYDVDPFDAFGPAMGAKQGGMMKAAKGTYVTAKCKMGRNKKTRIV